MSKKKLLEAIVSCLRKREEVQNVRLTDHGSVLHIRMKNGEVWEWLVSQLVQVEPE